MTEPPTTGPPTTGPLTIVQQPRVLRPAAPAAGEPAAGGATVAVWDVDGTLTRLDTLLPFLTRVSGPARVARSLAFSAGRGDAKAFVLHHLLGGRRTADVEVIGRRYAQHVVARRLRPDSLRRWRWHRELGHRMVIASASPDLYVRHLGALLGADTVICTEMDAINGRLTGLMAGGNCRGAEKARRVLEHLVTLRANLVWAYADGTVDSPLLALADVPVRVRQHRRLYVMSQPAGAPSAGVPVIDRFAVDRPGRPR